MQIITWLPYFEAFYNHRRHYAISAHCTHSIQLSGHSRTKEWNFSPWARWHNWSFHPEFQERIWFSENETFSFPWSPKDRFVPAIKMNGLSPFGCLVELKYVHSVCMIQIQNWQEQDLYFLAFQHLAAAHVINPLLSLSPNSLADFSLKNKICNKALPNLLLFPLLTFLK